MTPGKSKRALPTGPHSLSRVQVEQSQRERLYVAMIESVAAKGYAQTSVADVLARSGVSRATFYAFFNTKEECFRATYEKAAEQVASSMASSIQDLIQKSSESGRPQDALAQIDWVLALYLDMLASQPALAKAFLVEVYAAGPAAVRQRQASLEGFIDVISYALRDRPDVFGGGQEQRFAVRALVHAVSSMVTNMVGLNETERLPTLHAPLMGFVRQLLNPSA
jgi:AcrR family transcriptional regulator